MKKEIEMSLKYIFAFTNAKNLAQLNKDQNTHFLEFLLCNFFH